MVVIVLPLSVLLTNMLDLSTGTVTNAEMHEIGKE